MFRSIIRRWADSRICAFAGESQANRRYLYFADKADIVGATLFIEIPKTESVRPALGKLIGLDDGKSIWLEIGGNRAYAALPPSGSAVC